MQKYRLVAKKGEGTFSEVLKAQSVKTNKFAAIKCMRSRFDSIEQVCTTTTRVCTAVLLLLPVAHMRMVTGQ